MESKIQFELMDIPESRFVPLKLSNCSNSTDNKEDTCKQIRFELRDHTYAQQTVCYECNKSFCSKRSLDLHVLAVHLRRRPRTKCEYCGKMIISSILKTHIDSVHKKLRENRCDICGKGYFRASRLKEHVEAVHLKQIICTICDRTFSSKCNLAQHIKVIHSNKPKVKCPKCERSFTRFENMNIHYLKQHEKAPMCFKSTKSNEDKKPDNFVCDICNKSFTQRHIIQRHMRNIHLNEIISKYPDSRRCEHCTKFVLNENYQEHVQKLHKLLRCKICDKTYYNISSFENHVRTHEPKIKQYFPCEDCNRTFTSKKSRIYHSLAAHSPEPPRTKCEHCGKMVISMALKQHIHDSHTKQRKYQCKICQKNYLTSTYLREHQTTVHLKEQNHVCSFCNRKFIHKRTLERHYNDAHYAKPKPICQLCNKTFSNAGHFNKHVKRCEQLPFKCTFMACRTMYETQEGLDKHFSRYHTSPKWFRYVERYCTQCCKKCTSNLAHHLKAHPLKIRYQCHFCGLTYVLKHKVKEHLLKNHIDKF